MLLASARSGRIFCLPGLIVANRAPVVHQGMSVSSLMIFGLTRCPSLARVMMSSMMVSGRVRVGIVVWSRLVDD